MVCGYRRPPFRLPGKLKKMAAFGVFSNSNEKTTDSYNVFIQRLQRETKLQLGNKPIYCAADYTYYFKYKDTVKQYVFKDFIYQLRLKSYDGTNILICENLTPTFKCFVRLIERLKTPDNSSLSIAYYGEIKKIITGFMSFFTTVIDETEKKLDKYIFLIDTARNQLLLDLIDDTIAINDENQTAFLEEYLPLNTEIEKEKYQEVIDAHAKCLAELTGIKEAWETRQNKLENFMKDTFEASIKKICELCFFAHSYIAMMLADRLFEITESINETAIRINYNLRTCKEDFAAKTKMLIQNLYEKNKEFREIYRRKYKESNDTAEISKTIDLLKEKIRCFDHKETIARLELEARFWNKKLRDFNEISSVLVRIRSELDNLYKELEEYNSIKASEQPGSDMICFKLMRVKIDEKIAYYKKKQLDMSKALMTFFCVKGTDRTLYTNRTGDSFYIDEFSHQNYIKNYGMKYFHVNCEGDYLEHSENTPYYFDENGRYTLNNKGEKIYQVAACTSQYRLDEDDLFKKITKDCGHSEKHNPECRLAEIKDKMSDRMILPKVDAIDMTGMLDSESVQYLWDNYGMILAEVLTAVATEQPRNPIHFIGHMLLKRRFEASTSELRKLKKMGLKYRKDIEKERMDKAIAERRAWETKLMKRSTKSDENYREPPEIQEMFNWILADSMGFF